MRTTKSDIADKTRLDKHIYEIDEIIVGGSLSSLLYAFYTNKKVLFTQAQKPFLFEEIDVSKIPNVKTMFTNRIPSIQLWEHLLFALSLNGQIIGSNLNKSIRIQDDILKITTEFSRLTRIKFNKLVIFEPEMIEGIPSPISTTRGKHQVYDWFNVHRGALHTKTVVNTSEDYVNKIWFYSSERDSTKKEVRDCVVMSLLTDEQISSFDYSETITRIRMESLFKELGIDKHPLLEHADREIYENIKRVYEPHDRFQFLDLTPGEIVDIMEPKQVHKYGVFFPHGRYSTNSIEAYRL
jgi:hypothetical protein